MLILTVIKWIGIVLLCLLLLVLLLLGLILFVPVRYYIKGSYISDVPDGTAGAGWFLRILQVTAEYHRVSEKDPNAKGLYAAIRLFGFPVRTLAGGNQKDKDSLHESQSEAETGCSLKEDTDELTVMISPPDNDEISYSLEELPAEHLTEAQNEQPSPEKEEQVPGFFERLKNSVLSGFHEAKDTLTAIYRMIREKTYGAEKLLQLWKAEENQKALDLLKKELVFLLKELIPRKGSGKITLGTGDPYSTGQAMQAAAMLYPLYKDRIDVIPDFSDTIHDAKGELTGSIHLYIAAWAALRVILNKQLRKLYRQARSVIQNEIL